MSSNLYERLLGDGKDRGHIAVETHDGECLSYGDVISGSGRMANALTSLGVKAGDRVAVQAEKSAMTFLLYLACLRAGAVFLPLNTAYTLIEVEYFLSNATPSLVICDPGKEAGVRAVASRIGAQVATLDAAGEGSLANAVRSSRETFSTVERQPTDLAAILYTSGTTGRSKGAMLTHENLHSNAATLVEAWQFTAADVLVHALPIYHAHGLFVAVNTLLLAGGTMMFLPRFDADAVMALLPRATAMMGVPTFYTRLLQHSGLTRDATRRMRVFISGSAPLLPETHRAWKERTGHAILERYGLTETTMNTSNPYDGDRIPGSVGLPLAGIKLRIADPESGVPMKPGEVGMIEVRGPNVFKGYWGMPEKTASEFQSDGFFITGDLGRVDERGYCHIVGRSKDLIISGGFNVYPKEVEADIDEIAGVAESAVIGVPHPDFGEGVTAVIVREPQGQPTEADILAHLESRLAKFKLPKRLVFVAELPRNAMGKVQKNVLRERFHDLYATPPDPA